MSKTIFEQVEEKAAGEKRSVSWYRRQVKLIAKNYSLDLLKSDERYDDSVTKDFQDTNEIRNEVRIGHLYLFEYKASSKISFYDTFPLVYVIDRQADYFVGANLHYMGPKARYTVIDNLIKNNYLKVPPNCVHKYLSSNVSGRFLDLGKDEWDTAIFLPIENFIFTKSKKEYSKRKVWDDTYKAKTKKAAFKIPRVIEFYDGIQNSKVT